MAQVFKLEGVVKVMVQDAITALGNLKKAATSAGKALSSVNTRAGKLGKKLPELKAGAEVGKTAIKELGDAAKTTNQQMGGIAAKAKAVGAAVQAGGARAKAGGAGFRAAAGGLNVLRRAVSAFFDVAFVAGGIAAPFVAAIKVFGDFEASLRNVNVIARESEEGFRRMSERQRRLTRELGFAVDPIDANNALYQIYSANIGKVADANEVLIASLKASKAGLTDVKVAADAITSILGAYNDKTLTAARVSDVLFKTVELGKTTFPELANSIGDVVGIAANAQVSLEALNAVIAAATVKGLPTTKTVRALRQVISKLINPTKEAESVLEEYGIALDENSLKGKGLIDKLLEIQRKTEGNKEAISDIVGNVRAFNLVLSVLGDEGDRVIENYNKLEEASLGFGATQDAVDEQTKSLNEQFAVFKELIREAGIEFGEALAPAIGAVLGLMNSFLELLLDLSDGTPKFTKQVFAVSIAIGGLVTVLKLARGALISFGVVSVTTAGKVGILSGALAAFGKITGLTALFTSLTGAMTGMSLAAGVLLSATLLLVAALGSIAVVAGAGAIAWMKYKNAQEEAVLEEDLIDLKNLEKGRQELALINDELKKVSGNAEEAGKSIAEAFVETGNAQLAFKKSIAAILAERKFLEKEIAAQEKAITEATTKEEKERLQVRLDFLKRQRVENANAQQAAAAAIQEAPEVEARIKADQELKEAQEALQAAALNSAKDLFKQLDNLEITNQAERVKRLKETQAELTRLKLGEKDTAREVNKRIVQEERKLNSDLQEVRDDRFKDAVSNIENRLKTEKIKEEQAIKELKALKAKLRKDETDQARSLRNKIAGIEKKIIDRDRKSKQSEDRKDLEKKKALAKSEAELADTSADVIDKQIQLAIKQRKSISEINELIRQRLELRKQEINANLKAAKLVAKSEQERRNLTKSAEQERRKVETEAALKTEEVQKKIRDEELKQQTNLSKAVVDSKKEQVKFLDFQIDQQKELQKTGKNTFARQTALLKKQLQLRKDLIEEQLQSELRAAEARKALPEELAALEEKAEARKQKAVLETRDAIRKLKEEQEGTRKSGIDTIKTFDEFLASMQDTSFGQSFFAGAGDQGVSGARGRASGAAGSRGLTTETAEDIQEMKEQTRETNRILRKEKAGPSSDGATTPRNTTQTRRSHEQMFGREGEPLTAEQIENRIRASQGSLGGFARDAGAGQVVQPKGSGSTTPSQSNMSTITPGVGGRQTPQIQTDQTVRLRLIVDGEVKVIEGKLSSTTANGFVTDTGLVQHIIGTKPTEPGIT